MISNRHRHRQYGMGLAEERRGEEMKGELRGISMSVYCIIVYI